MSTGDPILVALQKLEANLFERVGAEMGRQLDGFRLDMNARFDAIEVRLERLETEYHMIVAALLNPRAPSAGPRAAPAEAPAAWARGASAPPRS